MILGGVGLALVLGVGYWMFSQKLSQLEADADAMEDRVADIKANVKKGAPDTESAEVIEKWLERKSDWMEEMIALRELLPASGDLIIEKMDLRTSRKDETRASFRLSGIAKSRGAVDNFGAMLEASGYLPGTPVPEPSSRDEDYSVEFTLPVSIPLPKPEESNDKT